MSFLYSVSEGDSTDDLDTNGQNSLVLPEGAAIKVRGGSGFGREILALLHV